jgi:hypothetical protein
MTIEKKTPRKKKPVAQVIPEETPAPEPWTLNTRIQGTITLQEPTAETPGIGLFLLEGGLVRWSVVTINPENGNQ